MVPKKIFLILPFLWSVSCQTVDIADKKYNCNQLDWFEVGRSDGLQGLDSLSWENKEKQCKGFNDANHESYVNGWYAGVDEFCSYSHGFAFGKSGHKYLNVCPTGKEERFLEAYRKGLKIYQIEIDNKSLADELQKLSEKVSTDPKQTPDLHERIKELEAKMQYNRASITEINREADESISHPTTL